MAAPLSSLRRREWPILANVSFQMTYSPQQRAKCVEWFIEEEKSVAGFQKRYRREFRAVNRNATAPDAKSIKNWYDKFQEGDLKNKKRVGTKASSFFSLMFCSYFPVRGNAREDS